jgi:hypothetical protein
MLPLRNSSVSRLTSPWATVAAAQIASELAEECGKGSRLRIAPRMSILCGRSLNVRAVRKVSMVWYGMVPLLTPVSVFCH